MSVIVQSGFWDSSLGIGVGNVLRVFVCGPVGASEGVRVRECEGVGEGGSRSKGGSGH